MGAFAELEDLRMLGRGAFGSVYWARQPRLGRCVAVKVLAGDLSPDQQGLFIRECQTMGALSSHANVVTVYDAGLEDDRLPFLIMQYHPAGSLHDTIQHDGPLSWPDACAMGAGLGAALAEAHGMGIVHRDIKPQNVLLSSQGEALLADFGLAKFAGQTFSNANIAAGTVAYMAPELLDGHENTQRSDVYALGATIHEALFGHPPHLRPGMSMTQLLAAIATSNGVRITDPDIPEDLAAGLEWALARESQQRPTAEDLVSVFRADLNRAPTDRQPAPAQSDPKPPMASATKVSQPGLVRQGPVRQQAVLAAFSTLGATTDLRTITEHLRTVDPALGSLDHDTVRNRVATTLNVLQHKGHVANDPVRHAWSLSDGAAVPPARTKSIHRLSRGAVVDALDALGGRGPLPAVVHHVIADEPLLAERGYRSVYNSVASVLSHLKKDGRVDNNDDRTWSLLPAS